MTEHYVRERFFVELPHPQRAETIMRETLSLLLDYLEKNKPLEGFDPQGLYEAAMQDVIAFRDLV